MLVFRCEYWQGVYNLRIRKEFRLLVSKIRAIAGENFLSNMKLVIAHPATQSLFNKLYALSFVSSEPKRKDRFAQLNKTRGYRREVRVGCF